MGSGLWRESKHRGWNRDSERGKQSKERGLAQAQLSNPLSISDPRINLTMSRYLAQDGDHVAVSSWKQQTVDQAVAMLQGEELSVTGTVCHTGKAEDLEQLVAKIRDGGGGCVCRRRNRDYFKDITWSNAQAQKLKADHVLGIGY